jgi:hypothetical protein
LRSVRVAVPFAFKFDLGMMLRERAKPHGPTLRSTRPGLHRLRLWTTNAAVISQRLLAPLAG